MNADVADRKERERTGGGKSRSPAAHPHTHTPPHQRFRRRGFTLLEALVALVLAAVVIAGVAMALRTGLDASDRIRERADAHGEARAALGVLAADVSAAFLSGANTE